MRRRSFLGFLAASPIAAKAAASKAAAEVSAMSMTDVAVMAKAPLDGLMSAHAINSQTPHDAIAKFIIKNGIPDFKREEMRKNAQHVRALDIDIASMRSLSPVAKLSMQARRNYQNYEQAFMAQWMKSGINAKARQFSEKYGWWL